MPELPEVETTVRGIRPHLVGQRIGQLVVRDSRLRWPVPKDLPDLVVNQKVVDVTRRGKYILISTSSGTMLLHLGMSGSLRVLPATTQPVAHDHLDIILNSGACLRMRDPRRFGCLLWAGDTPFAHPLLRELGPEPLSDEFCADYLYQLSRNRRCPVKTLIMDSHVLVGVGNIYASESLYAAGIHPRRAANRISLRRYQVLVAKIKSVLREAVAAGGTTLRDFTNSEGKPGYFRHNLSVYGREDLPCKHCHAPIRQQVIGQRSTFYCAHCQT